MTPEAKNLIKNCCVLRLVRSNWWPCRIISICPTTLIPWDSQAWERWPDPEKTSKIVALLQLRSSSPSSQIALPRHGLLIEWQSAGFASSGGSLSCIAVRPGGDLMFTESLMGVVETYFTNSRWGLDLSLFISIHLISGGGSVQTTLRVHQLYCGMIQCDEDAS